jgi:hypothetical protein
MAVTVYVWAPVVEVSKCPLPPVAVRVPFESSHDDSPGPPVASAQLKLVATTAPSA